MKIPFYEDEDLYKEVSMKKWYHSKTLWSNVIGIIVIIVSTVCASEEMAQEILTAEASILVIINLILRAITRQGLER